MSKIEVNTVAPQCGTTLTLGESGDTVTLGTGASQSGFGRTGTVDWDTTPKTATFTAVSGDGFFANTTGSAFNMNLPAGVAGAIVSVADYAGTWQNNALTVVPNGSDKIGGVAANVILNTEGQSVTFIFVDSTQGWVNVQDSTSNERGSNFISATGGNATLTNGDFKTHVFTSPGTFCVSAGAGALAVAEYLVVAGGGGAEHYGGGGAGGFRSTTFACVPSPTTSPNANSTKLSISPGAIPITVGAGGPGGSPPTAVGGPGSNSIFSTITSAGGGGGRSDPNGVGDNGGSGGGSRGSAPPGPESANPFAGGSGNTPSVSPPQGNPGGAGFDGRIASTQAGGGGGAGAAGTPAPGAGVAGGGGVGDFIADTVLGPTAPSYGTPGPASSVRYFAGGGGSGTNSNTNSFPGGSGGGGAGGGPSPSPTPTTNGATNTGGGAGGNGSPGNPRSGGSGIVVIRYKFQ